MLTISLILVLTILSAGELYAQKAQRFRGIQLIGPTSKNQNAQKNQGVALLAPANMNDSYSLVFPQAQGSTGQVLSRGSGDNLAWVSLTDQSWSIVGNSTVDSTQNFIGTTNTNANAPLIFKTDGDERMRITGSAGWVGIGVANPAALLDVNGTMRVGGTATLAGTVTMSSVAAGTASDDVLLINASNQITKVSRASLLASVSWSLTGNATTTNGGTLGSAPSVGGNFIGTTDVRTLSLATNNVIQVQIATDGVMSTNKDAVINTVTFGMGAGAIASNTAAGRGALAANTTGANNVAVGRDALLSNTDGYRNVAVGLSALQSNTSGFSNQAIGFEVLRANQSGYMNTAMGLLSLTANTTGYQNVALGAWSMYTNTTGQQHTAIGVNALYSNTTSLRNTAVGSSAMFGNTTGSMNTAIGGDALYSNLAGGENVAVGTRALYTVNASSNTAVGADALYFSTTATTNTAVGFNAQKSNTTGGNNVSIGAQSLRDNQTGTSNVAIGYQAGFSETGSSKLYIANSNSNNLIYGDFSTGVLSINAGTTPSAPGASLQVNAFNGSTKGMIVKGGASQAANLLELQNSAGTVLMFANSDGTLSLNPRGTAAGNTNELRFAELVANGTNYVGFKAADGIAANAIWTLPNADGTSGQVLSTNGSGVLSWVTGLTASSGWSTSGNSTSDAWNGTSGTRLGTTSAQPLVLATTNATAQDIRFYTGANGASERMRITGNGRVGIGVTSPTAVFEVQASGGGDEVFNLKRSNGTTVLKSDILGRVLINTTDAGGWLTVKGSGGNGGNLQLQSMTDVKWEVSAGNTSGPHGTAGFSIWGNFSNVSGSGTLRFGIDTNGRTGIGTHTQYDAMLDVRNTVAASNVLNLRGASSQSANYVTIENNAGLDLITVKSTGALSLEPTGASAGNTNELRFVELAANGTNYVGLKAADAIAANAIWTLPNADGTNGQILSTNGSGVLSWVTGLTASSGWSTSGNSTSDAWNGTSGTRLGTTSAQPLVIATTNATAQDIRFFTGANGASERMRITSDGSVAIGTTVATTSRLSISGGGSNDVGVLSITPTGADSWSYASSSINGTLPVDGTIVHVVGRALSSYNAGYIGFNHVGVGSTSNFVSLGLFSLPHALNIQATGRVGIGTTTPSQKLTVMDGHLYLDNTGTAGEVRLREPSASGSEYTAIRAGAQTSNITLTLPTAAPTTNGQVLSSTIDGTMSWASALTSTSGWSTTGNTGLSSATNFLGTTDSVDLVFRHTNTERLRLSRHGIRIVQNGTPRSSQWAASFQNIGGPVYLELLNSDTVTNGGGMYMGMRGTGSVGDTATIWNWQGGPLAFYTASTNRAGIVRLMVDNDGDVGIGSHIPTARLHVRGGNVLIDTVGSTSGQLLFRNPQGTASTGIRAGFQTSDITYWLPATAPSVNGQVLTANTAGVMEWANISSQSWGLTGNSGTSASTNFMGTTDPVDVVFKRDNTERARITSAGLRVVQNGTPRSSVWTLSVQNITTTNASTVIEFLNSTTAVNGGGAFIGLNGNGAIGDTLGIWNHQAGPIEFQTGTANRSNTPRMRIEPNGNVSIGNTTAGTLLDVDGAITVRPPATIAVVADNQAVTVGNRSSIVLESNGLPANRTITLSNGLQTGQLLFIAVTGTVAANGIEIVDDPAGANTNLSGLAQLVDGAVLQLLWNGTDWLEVSRSNN